MSATAKTAQLTTLLEDATKGAAAAKQRVETLAKLLADEMHLLHGHPYRIEIDHSPSIEFVMIVPSPRSGRPIAPSGKGEAA